MKLKRMKLNRVESIHCQVYGLVEMGHVWRDRNQQNAILFQYIHCIIRHLLSENIH